MGQLPGQLGTQKATQRDPLCQPWNLSTTVSFALLSDFTPRGATGLGRGGSDTFICRVNKECFWGRGKIPLVLSPDMHKRAHIHTHVHTWMHTRTGRPSLHVTIHQPLPACCLQADFPTDVLQAKRRRQRWRLEREGRQRGPQRVKTLPC